eukprot:1042867-Rhodomonas_salina.1
MPMAQRRRSRKVLRGFRGGICRSACARARVTTVAAAALGPNGQRERCEPDRQDSVRVTLTEPNKHARSLSAQ